ncbi:MFS transporter [Paenibacillus thalictri]|uniref:MFS transporter n=1 Tax=Paenibacillus thalictri TaxID=2527873 RepID=UPI001F116371|nr:MFS transporter [Paenibacillus thalictri]
MTNTEQKLWNRNFVAVCFSSFFLFMTFYILAVTLPIYVMDTLQGGKQQIGLVTTVFIIAAVIFRPLAGKWLDDFDKKKIIIVSLVIFMLCSAAYTLVHSLSALLLLRFIHGIGFGMASTATGAVAVDLVPDERKGEGIGYFSLFMSLAMVIGPTVGLTVMDHFSSGVMFILCLVFALIACFLGVSLNIPKKSGMPKTPSAKGWKSLIEPGAVPIALAGSILAFSYGAITTFISVYAKDMGIGPMASYFFMVFAAMIVISRPFTGKMFDRKGPNVLVYPGILLFTAGMILLSLAHTSSVFLAAGAVIGLGFGALLPSFQTIAVQSSPGHRRGAATGTYFTLFDSGYGLGSYMLGILAARTNYHTMYFIAALVVACTAILYYSLHHRKTSKNSQGVTTA